MTEQKNETTSSKAEKFVSKNAKILIVCVVVIACAVAGYILGNSISSKSSAKALAEIDNISYELTKDSAALETTELDARRATAFEKLVPYAQKGGVVGVRANMLCADLAYQQEKYEDSAKYWEAVAAKSKKSYTAPLAYFNAAVSYENINDLDNAEKYYKYAVSAKDFLMASHAEFSLGRVREAKGDTDGAIEAYRSLLGKNPDTSWGNLAKTRLIALGAE